MIVLSSASCVINITTSRVGSVDVHASYVDITSGVATPGRTNKNITTATTTSLVPSPAGAPTYRGLKFASIRNVAATPNLIEITHFDGSNTVSMYQVELGAGGSFYYSIEKGWYQHLVGTGPEPDWWGNLYAPYGRCDPQQLLRMATMGGSVAATPTNITASVSRSTIFTPPKNITVDTIRFYGVGLTTNIYTYAIYEWRTGTRVTSSLTFSTAANAWGTVATGLGLTLTKDTTYISGCSVNTTGTTAGILCINPTSAATTGQIAVQAFNWPGSLTCDSPYLDGALAQYAVSAGAHPASLPTIIAAAAYTGGVPLFFLDAAA